MLKHLQTKNSFWNRIENEGELMKPSISFNIVLPEGNNSVSTEIINTTQAKLTQLRQQQMNLTNKCLLYCCWTVL
jgi:hypothetical protein